MSPRPRDRGNNVEHRQAIARLRRGDLIVETTIVVPENLTEEQQRMMREFADAGGMKY